MLLSKSVVTVALEESVERVCCHNFVENVYILEIYTLYINSITYQNILEVVPKGLKLRLSN
jgi:hypothetical protein